MRYEYHLDVLGNANDAEQLDRLVEAHLELCPIGRRILLLVADRLVFGHRTKGPWKRKAKTLVDPLEEAEDGLIYVAAKLLDAIEDADGGE